MMFQTAFKCALFLQAGYKTTRAEEIIGVVASPNSFIILEEEATGLTYTGPITITSDIPVTLQRFRDNNYDFYRKPESIKDGLHLSVSSSCAASDVGAPTVRWGGGDEDGLVSFVEIETNVSPEDAASMPFLGSSYYQAYWTYEEGAYMPWTYWPTPSPPTPVYTGDEGDENNKNFGFIRNLGAMLSFPFSFVESINGVAKKGKKSSNSCTYNVEVLYDGCFRGLDVKAPSARIIDSVFENVFTENSSSGSTLHYEFSSDFTFPDDQAVDLRASYDVAAHVDGTGDDSCYEMVPGRPYVDISGKVLKALPRITHDDSWLNEASIIGTDETKNAQAPSNTNITNHHQLLLGEEWTKNALGEHASVASFSAFSIALMTNHAPSYLVEDALKAGLDEIRHARTSFKIASKLTGRNVGPGPLPQSTHKFKQDLTSLAMAVAKEGCIDETLSAFVAVAEIELMNDVLENGTEGTKYSSIDVATLTWIRDELLTIATEESNHSALAWRTLNWVCSVDINVCNAVEQHVFEESAFKDALLHRFNGMANGNPALLEQMKISWENIHEAHKDMHFDGSKIELIESSCADDGDNAAHPLLLSLTQTIMDGVLSN